MTDLALQIAGSKLAISIVLGGAVWLAARGNERPRLCHALCLTLFAALLVPPLIGLPVLQPEPSTAGPADVASRDAAPPVAAAIGDAQPAAVGGAVDGGWLAAYGGSGLVLLWLVGAVVILGWTVARTRSFRRSLRGASREAPAQLQRMAGEIARSLGLAKVPTIRTTDAVVSPMVYWGGDTARVLIPSALVEGLSRTELRYIVAHELAHVRRRDHLVRWIEWLACTAFWWNPVAWWARRRLRAAGEVCSDAMVVRALRCAPRDYARTLVRAIDLVRTEATQRPPVFASAADSGRRTRLLERRLRMIVTNSPASALPRAIRLVLRGGLVASLALGLVYCSEQASPTALEVPPMDEPLGDPSKPDDGGVGLALVYDAETDRLRWNLALAHEIRADKISWSYDTSWSAGGKDEHRFRGLAVVDYDDEVEGPLSQNVGLWAAAAERAENLPDTKFLIAQPTEDGGWRFLDGIPEMPMGSYHIMTFGSNSPAGWEFSLPAGPRASRPTER
ncbi:M56 family metallopeptidase [Candidatus Palauibacter sp.]|uniref:M56 family metallopeptidase n=1 Tax=Candidatus Palauibacter sp. TaxID=3101350 RepID=UPI003AF30DD7